MPENHSSFLPVSNVPFSSLEGIALLGETPRDQVRWELFENFLPQDNPYYCGVACISALVKASRPRNEHFFSQDSLFDEAVEKIREKKQALNQSSGNYAGLSVENIRDILLLHFQKVELSYGSDLPLEDFRKDLEDNFGAPKTFFIANFDGKVVGINSNGHTATLGAVNSNADRILLLDPAAHKRGWFWVPTSSLFAAFQNTRKINGRSRGYLKVQGGLRG